MTCRVNFLKQFWFYPNIESTTNTNYIQFNFIFVWKFSGLDYEYSGKGITVQCLCPGPVATDMVSGILKGGVISKGIFTLFPIPQTNEQNHFPHLFILWMVERSIFQTFWKPHCCTKFLFLETMTVLTIFLKILNSDCTYTVGKWSIISNLWQLYYYCK